MSSSSHGSPVKAILYALLANGAIALAKSIAAFLTGSGSMLAVKIKLHSGISIELAVDQINALEKQIKTKFPEVQWCFVEPDRED